MKHEQSAQAGYRPRFAGTMKLYLVRHKEYGELTVNGVNKYEAVHAAARKWGVRWTAIARGAAGRAGAREQICGAPFQRRGRLYPRLPRLPRGARRELRGTSRRRRGRSKPYALRLFPGYGRGGRISEIRRRMAILPRSVPLLGGAGQGAISRGAYRHRGAGAHSFRGYGLFFDRAL